jgi:phosphatidyl-myo-inositol dimannoside synthase
MALRDGELGELVDPDSPESIRQGILRALAKPAGIPPGLAYFGWPSFQQRLATAVNALMPRGTLQTT